MARKAEPVLRIGGELDHATYSASGSSRWLACAASISLSLKAPVMPSSIYAEEGTEAHACHEFLLKNRKNLKSAIKIARKKYSQEMVDHAIDSVTWILEQHSLYPDAELLCETRVDASPYTMADQFGTVDAAIVVLFGKLTVIDYKYGAGIAVDPEGYDGLGNSQMVYYALGISHKYHHNFSSVDLVVIQPRAFHASGNTTRTFSMSMDELLAWVPVFKAGVKASLKPDAGFKSGEWCRFCNAAVICPELKTKALKQAKIDFSDTKGIVSVPKANMVGVKDLGVMLDACDQLDTWITALREHAFGVLQRGGKIDGYKLVEKRATRKWSDPEASAAIVKSVYGDEGFSSPKIKTPAQIEKLKFYIKSFNLNAFLDTYTVKESSGLTMVKDTDKRMPVNKLTTLFDAVKVIDVTPKKKKK